jgi:sulfite exporter TauE/SafE
MNTAAAESLEVAAPRGLFGRLRRKATGRSVSFPELVWLHHLRQRDLEHSHRAPYTGAAEDRYREFEARFEEQHGTIVSSYWCTNEASAIALTIKRRPLLLADVVRLHWATDWSTKDKPKLMALLYETEALSVRVQEVLRDTSRRLAIQSLFNVLSFLLGFAETDRANNDRAVAEVQRMTHQHLKRIETYYRNAAARSGQIVYVGGMLLGMVPMLLLALIAWITIAQDANSAVAIGIFCFCAGAVGALMSVMSRLSSGTVRVDWEFGKDTLRTLGSLRPFVGAIFGLMTYLALRSGIVALDITNGKNHPYYYIVFAFAAGFSERLAQDMLLGSTLEAVTRRGSRRQDSPEEPGLPSEEEIAGTASGTAG